MKFFISILMLLMLPILSGAHHSFSSTFHTDQYIEIEGVITRVLWRNPHVMFMIDVANEDGEIIEWEIEANSLSLLRRAEISRELFNIGDQVRISGWPSRYHDTEMFVINMLLPSDEEVLWWLSARPLWSNSIIGNWDAWRTDSDNASDNTNNGIFGVWTTNFAARNGGLWNDNYPLTEFATNARNEYDPGSPNNPLLNCQPKGMPFIMEQPYPSQFIDMGDTIIWHGEEYDTMRIIYMDPDSTPNKPDNPILGLSVGEWNDQMLVVKTNNINYGSFDPTGIPLTSDVSLVERFTPIENGNRIIYEVEVADPNIFTETIILDSTWTRATTETVSDYDCTT